MQLTVPCNWEDDYFEKIDFSQTAEIYGKRSIDLIGGGRPALTMPYVSKDKVKKFVAETHRRGMEFNYLLNGTCFDNLEISKKGYRNIRKLLDWLAEIKVDSITVSLPMILEIITKHYPNFKSSVSVQVIIDCVEKAKYWEDLGAYKLNISYVDLNKNFDEIRRIKNKTSCKIQTIANLKCRNRCPHVTLHGNYNAHTSQNNHVMNNFSFDYYLFSCVYQLLNKPSNILKSAFIRPEDIHLYEEAGVDYIKLVERSMTSDALSLIIKAYSERSYDGNMMDLIHGISKYIIYNDNSIYSKGMKYIFQPSKINIFKVKKIMDHLRILRKENKFNESFNLYIDNKKLNGFMDKFAAMDCPRDCDICSYCEDYAEKAISYLVPIEKYKKSVTALKETKDIMISGELFMKNYLAKISYKQNNKQTFSR